MNKKIIIPLIIFSITLVSQAMAHNLWINSFESYTHKPGHTLVSLGWGHGLPMDDILTSPSGRIQVDRFELWDPSGGRTTLLLPGNEVSQAKISNKDFSIYPGDIGLQKLAFTKTTPPGVYQLGAVSRPAFYTQYIDTSGKTRLKMKSKDEIKGIKKVLMSVKYQAFAKACIARGKWQIPIPLGHGLEILPLTDLSRLHTGDMVRVKVLFYGDPLTTNAKSQEFITASGAGFGSDEGFALFSNLVEGNAQFRVQTPGQWRVIVKHKDEVTAEGPLKSLYGKAEQVYHAATLTFLVH
jgi:uncharacterized GH25 family protein